MCLGLSYPLEISWLFLTFNLYLENKKFDDIHVLPGGQHQHYQGIPHQDGGQAYHNDFFFQNMYIWYMLYAYFSTRNSKNWFILTSNELLQLHRPGGKKSKSWWTPPGCCSRWSPRSCRRGCMVIGPSPFNSSWKTDIKTCMTHLLKCHGCLL